MSTVLEVRGLTKHFGDFTALRDVSFTLERGEICGFIGPNGAGKTTTMRICSTLELPDTGHVRVSGHSVVEEPRQVRDKLGFMPDAFGAYGATSVTEYLDFFGRAYGLRGSRLRRTLGEVMDFTGLTPLSEKLTSSLSKGMKQRLCLAKTLLHDPDLLILDEPAAGLDPRARVELRELVRALAEMGKTVLVSSHILSELGEMCDSVVVIEAGEVMASGRVADIVRRLKPRTEMFVRSLEGPEALLRALVEHPTVHDTRPDRGGVVFDHEGTPDDLAALLCDLVRAGLRPVEFAPTETDLEDVFLSLTQGKLQ